MPCDLPLTAHARSQTNWCCCTPDSTGRYRVALAILLGRNAEESSAETGGHTQPICKPRPSLPAVPNSELLCIFGK